MTDLVQDLCARLHIFFYLKENRKPCPYCKIERLQAALDKIVFEDVPTGVLYQDPGDSLCMEIVQNMKNIAKAALKEQT